MSYWSSEILTEYCKTLFYNVSKWLKHVDRLKPWKSYYGTSVKQTRRTDVLKLFSFFSPAGIVSKAKHKLHSEKRDPEPCLVLHLSHWLLNWLKDSNVYPAINLLRVQTGGWLCVRNLRGFSRLVGQKRDLFPLKPRNRERPGAPTRQRSCSAQSLHENMREERRLRCWKTETPVMSRA